MYLTKEDAARLVIEPERRLRPFAHHPRCRNLKGNRIKDGIPATDVPRRRQLCLIAAGFRLTGNLISMLTALLGLALVGQEPAAKPPQAVPTERSYIWSPKLGLEPHVTSPAIFGLRPINPIVFRVTATGKRPIKYSAENLPPGLKLDPETGIFSGSVGFPGNFRTRITVKNSVGSETRELRFVVGESLCLTPPMGATVGSPGSVPALVSKLANSGWILAIPDINGDPLTRGSEVSAAGLKRGVIASKIASENVKQFAGLGIDAVFYSSPADQAFATLNDAFRLAGRDISLHLIEPTNVEVANSLRGKTQSWRTAKADNSWAGVSTAGFSQDSWSQLAGLGTWNDPGPLYIGGGVLSPSEQYSQMSLWCLLSAPLILATDPAKLDDFAISLLTNREVIEVNQDPLGKQARLTFAAGDFEVWSKLMEDQTLAIGVFNKGESEAKATLDFGDPSVKSVEVRDLWRQEKVRMKANVLPLEINRHGAMLFRTNKNVDFRFRLGHDPKKPKKSGGGGG